MAEPSTRRTLRMLDGDFVIHRYPGDAVVPEGLLDRHFVTLSRTPDELSILCTADIPVSSPEASGGWRGFRFEGALDFSEIGVLSAVAAVLAQAGISIFAVSTYDTDYIFLKAETLQDAVRALTAAGYVFLDGQRL